MQGSSRQHVEIVHSMNARLIRLWTAVLVSFVTCASAQDAERSQSVIARELRDLSTMYSSRAWEHGLESVSRLDSVPECQRPFMEDRLEEFRQLTPMQRLPSAKALEVLLRNESTNDDQAIPPEVEDARSAVRDELKSLLAREPGAVSCELDDSRFLNVASADRRWHGEIILKVPSVQPMSPDVEGERFSRGLYADRPPARLIEEEELALAMPYRVRATGPLITLHVPVVDGGLYIADLHVMYLAHPPGCPPPPPPAMPH